MTKVAIYVRVSTEEQNTDNQEQLIIEYCIRNNYEIFDTYKDTFTGTSDNRPEFNRMLIDMRLYKFNTIAVARLDRLTRKLKHLLSMIDEFKSKGVGLIAIHQNIDTTNASGIMQMQMLGVIAEFERNLISDRTKEAFYVDSEGKKRSRKSDKLVGARGKDKKERKKRGVLRRSQKQEQNYDF
jgi:site-specific DNA recombinase